MGDTTVSEISLSDGAREVLDCAAERWGDDTPLGIHQWLLTIMECRAHLLAALSPQIGDLFSLLQALRDQVRQGDCGEELDEVTLLRLAHACAHDEITARDLACVILTKAGYPIPDDEASSLSDSECDTIYVHLADPEDEETATVATPADSATPCLDQLGIDLTAAAREGSLVPVIGREQEIELVIETLCRSTKRNPALIGPAGVGKTAIVEGLAQRVVRGEVPAILHGLRIVMLSVSSLVANCKFVGEFEERMTALLKEARQPGIVLFIDEAHTMMGAGAAGRNGNDLANILKPALARGEIACLAATTDEEYRQFIESDTALERRFQPIRVQELSAQQTLCVLQSLCTRLSTLREVAVPEELLTWIVTFAGQHMPNRFFPDKAVDMLEQCVAYGLAQGKSTLAQQDVEKVAQRMVGMPLEIEESLDRLEKRLTQRSLLPDNTVAALRQRLNLTMRDLDFRAARPNAVLLLLDEAAAQDDVVSETIAHCLFGTADRVVTIDFSRIMAPSDLTMLLGAPPGYVGHGGRVALHQVLQTPWCVVRCEHTDAAHPAAREMLADMLRKGVGTLADGKRVFLSDTVVVLSAQLGGTQATPLGFNTQCETGGEASRERAERHLGQELLDQVDILCDAVPCGEDATLRWLRESLLADFGARFAPQGVQLTFDHSMLSWLLTQRAHCQTPTDWERLIEDKICPAIIPHLATGITPVRLRVAAPAGDCRVDRISDT